jgi:hypothetical protein
MNIPLQYFFHITNNSHKLFTSATTGNSAYHVSGNTIHSYLSIANYQNEFYNDEATINTKNAANPASAFFMLFSLERYIVFELFTYLLRRDCFIFWRI